MPTHAEKRALPYTKEQLFGEVLRRAGYTLLFG